MKEMHAFDTVVDKAGQLLFAGLRTKISMFHGEMTKVVPHTTTGPLALACLHSCSQTAAGLPELADRERLLLQDEQTTLVLQVSCMALVACLKLGLATPDQDCGRLALLQSTVRHGSWALPVVGRSLQRSGWWKWWCSTGRSRWSGGALP